MNKLLFILSIATATLFAAPKELSKLETGAELAKKIAVEYVKKTMDGKIAKPNDTLRKHLDELKTFAKKKLLESEVRSAILYANGSAHSYFVVIPFYVDEKQTTSLVASVHLAYNEEKKTFSDPGLFPIYFGADGELEGFLPKR